MLWTHRVDVVLAGRGTDERTLRRLATRLGVSQWVQFLGFVGDAQLPALLQTATLFVMPSPNELQSIATLEAMASGLPVVAPTRSHSPSSSKNAGGVPAEWVIPPGASAQRTIPYLHGGEYAVGAPRGYREMMSRIAGAAQAQALTIDYRLAPENPHPAAVEDAVAADRWLLGSRVEPGRTVLAGDSAGGGLTAATLFSLRDKRDRLRSLCHQAGRRPVGFSSSERSSR